MLSLKPIHFIIGGAVVLGGTLAARLFGMKSAAENLDMKIENARVGIDGMTLKTNAKIRVNNSQGQEVKFQRPYIKFYVNGTQVGNSNPSKEMVVVPARESAEFNVDLDIPFLNLATVLPGLLVSAATGNIDALKQAKLRAEAWTSIGVGPDFAIDVFDYSLA